ncbi:conserved hypothetical protein [Ricinus communis]|uniref:Uncharacterized protein n=1 Tax=Ricinus communis TaxID=3988 RepID=B9RD82_RICCO|nr:conserved hypothetical protein [Ricinus communis]
MDTTSSATPKAPPISEMFQKFALAFKTKTFEFFADEETATAAADDDGLSLLDSAEDFIPDQKVIILKPDQPFNQEAQPLSQQSTTLKSSEVTKITPLNTQLAQTLISSIFATVSSLEASYLQLQSAHVPFNEESITAADEALVSHLQRLADLKQLYGDMCKNPDSGADLGIGSCLEAQVQENQSKLRVLGTVSDHLQEEIDRKDNEVFELRKTLSDIQRSNFKLSKRLTGMFRGFDLKGFGLEEDVDAEILGNGHNSDSMKTKGSLKQLLEHVSSSPVELISRNPGCEFSKFCEKKYQELVHPTMESSIFSNLDHNEVVLNSWRSLSIFYESFVNMASSVWTLHKLAFSFDPVAEIFQVERGVDFSMVYMEDVTRRCTLPAKARMKVGFTVVPGFKVGKTIIQSQVWMVVHDGTGIPKDTSVKYAKKEL